MTIPRERIILYHMPPSFYSQVARLVLAEKKVDYTSYPAIAGPPIFETYQPWYIRLNPQGTIPTLVIDGEPIDDSRKILKVVDERFPGPSLTPNNDALTAEVEAWLDAGYALPERVLAYGGDRFRRLGAVANGARRRALVKQCRGNKELEDAYTAKIADIDSFMASAGDDAQVQEALNLYDSTLDKLDAHLSEVPYVSGPSYGLADVLWTVIVARQFMLGRQPLDNRAQVTEWYGRMKARPSFAQADVWEEFKPSRVLAAIAGRFPLIIASALFTLGLVLAVLVYAVFNS